MPTCWPLRLIQLWSTWAGVSFEQMIRIVAPILEEFLKALILIYLVQRADFNYVVDGAIMVWRGNRICAHRKL